MKDLRQNALTSQASWFVRWSALGALALTAMAVRAQNPVLPITFASAVAGQAPGGSTTPCTTTLPTAAGISIPGDGCPATQATLNGPYGATVDSYGNVFFGDYNVFALRVVYMGGAAMSAAIQAANPTQTFTPQVGYVYTLAGSRQGALSNTGSPKAYYCNGASGHAAVGSNGDDCPATYGYIKPRNPVIDKDGNVIFSSGSGGSPVRVVYVGGTAMANLINTLDGVTPTPGYIYSLVKSSANGYAGDGLLATNANVHTYSPRDVAVDSGGNIYMSDGTNSFTAPAYGSNNDIRRIDGVTGIITTYAGSPSTGTNACASGSTTGCAGVFSGDGGPATSATFNSPYTIFFDQYDNLYITDYNDNRLRVVYKGGTVPGLSNLTVGNVYTVAGGGATASTVANSNTAATLLSFGPIFTGGIDSGGNLYVADGTSRLIWRIDAKTGIANVVGGGHATTTTGTVCATGSTLVNNDKIGDGCPSTQAAIVTSGKLPFDRYDNFYSVENSNNLVRKYSLNTLFPATNVGSSVTQPLAFETIAAQTLTAETFAVQGGTTSDFSDAGNATCALGTATTAGATCVFNVKFAPTLSGLRPASLSLSNASATLISEAIGGTGVAAGIAVDPASTKTIGSGLTPSGVGTDLNGNLYVSDSTSNHVLKVAASGGTPTVLISAGLSLPGQIAVDGAGNVYVADTGNNRIAKVPAAGGTITALGSGLSKPQGVVVDPQGNLYVADTANNRIVQITPLGGQIALNIPGLSSPTKLALDGSGNLYIADTGNNRVLEKPQVSEAVAINLGTSTVTPNGVAVDAAGDIYLADAVSGQVIEYAPGVTNPDALVTGLTGPKGLAIDSNGSLYVADASASGAIAANRHTPATVFPNTNLNTSNTEPLNVTNIGNAPLLFNGSSFSTATGNTAAFSLTSASTNGCVLNTPLTLGAQCALTATFTPTAIGNYSETATFATNAANAGQALLSGAGVFLVSTTTTLAITQPTTSTIAYAQAVTVTATVTPATNAGTVPTGMVTFSVDGKKQTPQNLPASGVLTLTINPAVGTHAISVSYTGDTVYASSSNSLSFTVQKAATTTTLAIAPGGTVTPNLTFTATVSSTTATGETGTVTFYAGGVQIGTGTVVNGQATYTTTTLYYGSSQFTATYGGDVNFSGSTSTAVSPIGQFYVQQSVTAITVPQGGVGTIPLTLVPLFNYGGTVTAMCSGLPANSVCRFYPTSVSFAVTASSPNASSTAQLLSVYLYTNVQSNLAALTPFAPSAGVIGALLGLPTLLLGALAMRRRRGLSLSALVAVFGAVAMIAGLGGCASGVSHATSQYVTPQGTSNVTITLTDGSSASQSFVVALTVNAAYPIQ